MSRSLPTLIIPVEIKAREFLARLHVAARAVDRGYPVLFGHSKYFHRNPSAFPRGIILENDLTPQARRFFQRASDMGFGLVAWDEESIVTLTDDIFAELRVDEDNLRQVRRFFSRGPGDRDAIRRRFPHLAEKVVAVGNPRLEILQPKYYRHAFLDSPPVRPVILVNSRFSIVNPFRISPEKARANIMHKFKLSAGHTITRHVNAWLDHAGEALKLFHGMVERLPAVFPDCDIVIRPHPSEGMALWQNIADRFDNCICTLDGAAIDWILRADVLVHNSCTTAIESALLGVPALSYLPNYEALYDASLPNLLSERIHDGESLFAAIAVTRTRDEAHIAKRGSGARKILSQHVEGLCARGSSNLILDEIEVDGWRPQRLNGSIFRAAIKDRRDRILNRTAALAMRFRAGGRELQRARAKYLDQKFPMTETVEIVEGLQRFGIKEPRVRPAGPLWWRIESA